MQTIRPPAPADAAKLVLLGAIWSSAFVCIEVALTSFSPLAIASWRILIATAVLVPVVLLMGLKFPTDARTWTMFTATGFLYNALPFTLISWGQQHVSSGTAAIVIASGTFISLLLSHFLTHDDRFSLPKFAGVATGFAGVVVLIGSDALDGSPRAVAGQIAIVAAVTLYILSSLIVRRITGVHTLVISAGVLMTSCAYMGPLLLFVDRSTSQDVTSAPAAALVYLGLVPTALAYLLRIQIIRQVGTTFLSQVSFLIPIFGLLWGWLFLAEVPSPGAWLALVLVLCGISMAGLRGKSGSLR